jgi:hypothetical protein
MLIIKAVRANDCGKIIWLRGGCFEMEILGNFWEVINP